MASPQKNKLSLTRFGLNRQFLVPDAYVIGVIAATLYVTHWPAAQDKGAHI